jgi:hypothetical protein
MPEDKNLTEFRSAVAAVEKAAKLPHSRFSMSMTKCYNIATNRYIFSGGPKILAPGPGI